ncbi:hypothetical protein [Ponticaulis sp.]|uniref:hypothetical protein n=1 Tax=Ponticaulis sp. TaxID=2020902 RepID=UPI00261D4600|nr:hypothetical protein [Ponticaulis sp.]MDF1679458.1 hypothetical protein [Ponticaulis sp.]
MWRDEFIPDKLYKKNGTTHAMMWVIAPVFWALVGVLVCVGVEFFMGTEALSFGAWSAMYSYAVIVALFAVLGSVFFIGRRIALAAYNWITFYLE